MIALLVFLTAQKPNLSTDLEQAIGGEKIGSIAFTKSIKTVLGKYGIDVGDIESKPTLGDPRGRLLLATSYSVDDDSHPPIRWRIFFWPQGGTNRAQLIKKVDMYTSDSASYTQGDVYWRGDRLIIAGSEVTGGNSEVAAVTVYKLNDGTWTLAQHMGGGHEGYATFARKNGSVDPSVLEVNARDWPKYLEQPHVGPLLRYKSTWTLKGGRYSQGKETLVYTPLAEMETLAGYVKNNNRAAFDRQVAKQYQDKLWTNLKDEMMVLSVTNEVYDTTNQFQFGNDGPIVTMKMVKGRWRPVDWSPGKKS